MESELERIDRLGACLSFLTRVGKCIRFLHVRDLSFHWHVTEE